jgi:hypothetical protein
MSGSRKAACLPVRTQTSFSAKHAMPSAATPQPKLGISRAKTPRSQRSEKNGEDRLQDNQSFPSELGVLCALARVNPGIRVFQVTGKFA